MKVCKIVDGKAQSAQRLSGFISLSSSLSYYDLLIVIILRYILSSQSLITPVRQQSN